MTFTWRIEALPTAPDGTYRLWMLGYDAASQTYPPLSEIALPAAVTDPLLGELVVTQTEAVPIGGFALTVGPQPAAGTLAPVLLAGLRYGQPIELVVEESLALGTDFSEASGACALQRWDSGAAVPGPSGLWWGSPAGGSALVLPELPSGWTYEGWVVDGASATSTGRFVDPAGPDHDGAGDGDPGDAPPFPGQDFDGSADLRGLAAWITVEPEPDVDPGPFLPVLIDGVLEDTPGLQPAADPPPPLPSGTVDEFHPES